MGRAAFVAGCVAGVLLTSYLVVEAVGVTLLEDPRPTFDGGGPVAAAVAVGLLVADALLPVPASLVMISLGSLYGPVVGIALGVTGRFGMAIAALALGRVGGPVFERAVPDWDRDHARHLVDRYGALAIIVSRPVPLLAETVLLLAGAARMPWRRALAAAFVGSIPEAIAYSLVGAAAATFDAGTLVWLGFLVVALAFRLVERRVHVAVPREVTP